MSGLCRVGNSFCLAFLFCILIIHRFAADNAFHVPFCPVFHLAMDGPLEENDLVDQHVSSSLSLSLHVFFNTTPFVFFPVLQSEDDLYITNAFII